MGSRGDYASREKKKSKKDNKKITQLNIAQAPVEVEVIGKKKKKQGEDF